MTHPAIKHLACGVGLLLALPDLLLYRLMRPVLGQAKAFAWAGERVGRISGLPGAYARLMFYRWTLKQVGRDIHISTFTLFSKPQASLGSRIYIGRFCSIGWAVIEDDVLLADHVQILSGAHQHRQTFDELGQRQDDQAASLIPVRIGRGAWLGAGAIVMADVGQRAVVAAGAVVTRPVPDGATVGGVPAKVLSSADSCQLHGHGEGGGQE